MTVSTPSSVSRYRPAILVLTGAAAAYTAWLLYSTVSSAPPEGLQRSNAIRRPNHRPRPRASPARLLRILQDDPLAMGQIQFYGIAVIIDTRNLIVPAGLREIARELPLEHSFTRMSVDDDIALFYDTLLHRLLGIALPPQSQSEHSAETDAVIRTIVERFSENEGMVQAVARFRSRMGPEDAEATLAADGVESIAPTEASWRSDADTEGIFDPDGQTLQRTLYHIAEDHARHLGVIHRGITCNGCDTKPIRGIRWRCANCADFDLCSDCEATNSHVKTHIFYKIRVPAPYLSVPKQEPVYPGRPHAMSPSINSTLKARLVKDTNMEGEEIEALWDQFTCLAATEWESDPNEIGYALDRRAFNHAFIPRYSSFISTPNLIYDRVFAYFDTDQNTLIGFEEFIKGLDKMHSGDTSVKLRVAFNGYDVDGDGYISRKDVLRIFRAHYAIEREATRNYLAETVEELSVRGALEVIHSAQPLGSAFTHSSIPPGDRNSEHLQGKPPDDDINQSPIVDDRLDTMDPETVTQETYLFSSQDGPARNVNEAIRDQWVPDHSYTDEEGLAQPVDTMDGPSPRELDTQTNRETDEPVALEYERPRGSRSSSRVRFQDDVEIDTRSNASTSSRPLGERWGGYEIPEPDKDFGKEVLYQVTQQAFNELLDPLFKDKEDNAMDEFATRAERRACAAQIERLLIEFNEEKDVNKTVDALGAHDFAGILVEEFCENDIMKLIRDSGSTQMCLADLTAAVKSLYSELEQKIVRGTKSWEDDWQPTGLNLWNAKLYRIQLEQELIEAVVTLATKLGLLPASPPSPSSSLPSTCGSETAPSELIEEIVYRDPTLPQFRPNSLADLQAAQSSPKASPGFGVDHVEMVLDSSFLRFGPLFVMAYQPSNDFGSGEIDPDHPIAHNSSVPVPGVPPPQETAQQETLPSANAPTHIHTNDPMIQYLYTDPSNQTLRAWSHKALYLDEPANLARSIRFEAMGNPSSPLHLPFLASLDLVDREIAQRKGSGLLNFDEFETCSREGRARFLWSWMDWVSY